jgi:hypothetical protein
LTYETNDASIFNGYTPDESTKDEDATPDDDHMFQSVDVGDPTSFNMHDAYDVGSLSAITPMLDEDPTPYDSNDDADVIVP